MKKLGKNSIYFYFGTLIIVMLGYIVTLLVAGFLTDLVSGIVIFPENAVEEFALIDYLTPPRINWLVYVVGWFVVCFLVNYGSAKLFEEGEKVGILSSFFLILWFFTTSAIIIGFIINSLTVSTYTWNGLFDTLFVAPFWALAPTFAAILGVNDITS